MKMSVIHIRVTEAEKAELRRLAGEVPLGKYVRGRILEPRPDDSKPSPAPKPVSGPKPVAPEIPRVTSEKKTTCEHGQERRYLCGQCGGLARIVWTDLSF
jgi:hypothetical protein